MCIRCGIDKGEDGYYRNPRLKSGFHSHCKDCARSDIRKYRENKPMQSYIRNLKSKAKRENCPFDLTEDYLESIYTPNCPITNEPFSLGDGRTDLGINLDRKDPRLGYVKGNVAFIGARMNRIKSNSTVEELKAIIAWLEKD